MLLWPPYPGAQTCHGGQAETQWGFSGQRRGAGRSLSWGGVTWLCCGSLWRQWALLGEESARF